MSKKKRQSTREDFLKACEKNGIVFQMKKSDGKVVKRNYIEVVDDDGNVVKLTKKSGLFKLFPWLKTSNTKREFDVD